MPRAHKVLPLKRQSRIKNDGRLKVCWVVLDNLVDFEGETCAPMACSIVWLVFTVAVHLNLCWRWFDTTGAFMAERPQRDIYVLNDGKFYRLFCSRFMNLIMLIGY